MNTIVLCLFCIWKTEMKELDIRTVPIGEEQLFARFRFFRGKFVSNTSLLIFSYTLVLF